MMAIPHNEYPPEWPAIAERVKAGAGYRCVRCNHANEPSTGHLLLVVHADGMKTNCAWWNLLPLCNRCQINVGARFNPNVPHFRQQAPWFRPYAAGFYAKRYLNQELSRGEVMGRLVELLNHRRVA